MKKPGAESRRRGKGGEDCAAAFLERREWRVLARNFRCIGGEVDIIAQKRGILAFVEVKARRQGACAGALESVDAGKRRRVVLCAQQYLLSHPELDALQPRFDVAAVDLDACGSPCALRYYANAFTLDDC